MAHEQPSNSFFSDIGEEVASVVQAAAQEQVQPEQQVAKEKSVKKRAKKTSNPRSTPTTHGKPKTIRKINVSDTMELLRELRRQSTAQPLDFSLGLQSPQQQGHQLLLQPPVITVPMMGENMATIGPNPMANCVAQNKPNQLLATSQTLSLSPSLEGYQKFAFQGFASPPVGSTGYFSSVSSVNAPFIPPPNSPLVQSESRSILHGPNFLNNPYQQAGNMVDNRNSQANERIQANNYFVPGATDLR